MITDADLETFCAAVQTKRLAYLNAQYPNQDHGKVVFERGKRYARIITEEPASRSAFCFVDLTTGDILKADGWKSPKKGARGNISNGAFDVGVYGAAYLRH